MAVTGVCLVDAIWSHMACGLFPRSDQEIGGWQMLSDKRIIVVLPAYNASKTLERTFAEIPKDIVDDILLTDDASSDDTINVARSLGIYTLRHDHNRGYGYLLNPAAARTRRVGSPLCQTSCRLHRIWPMGALDEGTWLDTVNTSKSG